MKNSRQSQLFALTSGLVFGGRTWQRMVDALLLPYGLSAACTPPLIMISRSGGGLRQVELAQQVGTEGPSLVRQLDKLCAAGLVRRRADASDRRAKQLWLTDKGQKLADAVEQRMVQMREEIFGDMSPADIETVLRFFKRLEDRRPG